MRVVLIQPNTDWENKEANFEHIRTLLETFPPESGSLVVLPEMFAVGFSMNVNAIYETEGGPTERFLAEMARHYQVCMVGGLVTQHPDGRGKNEAVAVGPDGRVKARYAKIHPFRFAGETDHYVPGEKIDSFDWQEFSVAPFICYDLRFPEIYRIAVARGATLLVTIANFPDARKHHWRNLLVARAIENQAYVVGVNRTGEDPNVTYSGGSMVVDPEGNIMADAGTGEAVVSAELSLENLLDYRKRFPALEDFRTDFYRKI